MPRKVRSNLLGRAAAVALTAALCWFAHIETGLRRVHEGFSEPFAARRAFANPRSVAMNLEIMVVVIIIGLLAAVIVPQVISKVDEARVAKAKQDIQSLETALTMFRLDNSTYPTTSPAPARTIRTMT